MKNTKFLLWGLLLVTAGMLSAQTSDTSKIKPFYHEVNYYVEDNEGCLKCHGEMKFTLEDTAYGRSIVKSMGSDKMIERDLFYTSVHKSFGCTDCHDYEFYNYPHTLDSRFEEHMMCMDCHGYDEAYAQYNFEGIEMQSAEGIHADLEGFSCWSCHDPHSYRASMRTSDNLKDAVAYGNDMCLGCHTDFSKFAMHSDREEILLIDSHDWLPNQAAHIRSVRCIECHTEISDTILIAHKILPKEEAVRKCAECHSSDSRLMHTLYKFESREDRKAGFVNGVILNDSFVIGANQNPFLTKVSLLILAATLLGMGLHVFLRIRNRKSS